MGFLTKITAADLRQRAEAAHHAADQAEQQAGAARAEAARCLADGDADGARKARARALEAVNDAETQRDLAAELRRRADTAAKAEALTSYDTLRRQAVRSVDEGEKAVREALDGLGQVLARAQAKQQEASAAHQAATSAFLRLPEGVEAEAPPAPFDPLLTDGFALTRFMALSVWRLA